MTQADGAALGEQAPRRVGETLRAAREAKGMTVGDVATATRITQRHLEAIETSDYSALPGRTYISGFTRAYARAVDLPEPDIAAQLRAELAADDYAQRPAYETYAPADPARVPSRTLAYTALGILLLLVSAYGIWRFIAMEPGEELVAAQMTAADAEETPASPKSPAIAAAVASAASAPTVPANAPVVVTGIDEVWIGFEDRDGTIPAYRTLDPGESYVVPAEYVANLTFRTVRPQSVRLTVGGREVPTLGPADSLVKNVSLKPADLVARINAANPAGAAARPPATGAAAN